LKPDTKRGFLDEF